MRLKDKVAIVTGSSKGIGKGIALAFAREGAKVVINGRGEKIYEVLKEIEALGCEGIAVRVDVSNSKETEAMARVTIERFGRIDILVNNAGIYPFKPLIEMREEDWDMVLDVNLKGVFNCTKAVLPKMVEQKSGNIVNIASIAGAVIGYKSLAHYAASKAGIVGFTKAAALELAQYGIRVNAVAPGVILTEGTKVLGDDMLKRLERRNPLKFLGEPEDVANLVTFLVSDESRYITGQLMITDGGYTIP